MASLLLPCVCIQAFRLYKRLKNKEKFVILQTFLTLQYFISLYKTNWIHKGDGFGCPLFHIYGFYPCRVSSKRNLVNIQAVNFSAKNNFSVLCEFYIITYFLELYIIVIKHFKSVIFSEHNCQRSHFVVFVSAYPLCSISVMLWLLPETEPKATAFIFICRACLIGCIAQRHIVHVHAGR